MSEGEFSLESWTDREASVAGPIRRVFDEAGQGTLKGQWKMPRAEKTVETSFREG